MLGSMVCLQHNRHLIRDLSALRSSKVQTLIKPSSNKDAGHSELSPFGAMKEELVRLVTLQKYDLQILEIEDHLTNLSKDISVAEARLEKARQQTEEKEEKLKRLKAQSQTIETEINSLEEQYKENNYQLMTLKDAKAYESMKLQMEELKAQAESKEASGIELLSTIENEEKTLAMYHEKINAEAERIEGLKSGLGGEEGKRSEEKDELKQKRKGFAEHISPKLLSTYERLLNMPDRKALVAVNPNNRACTGCYSTITRENMENVKMMNDVVHCNSCGRIVYVPALLGSDSE